MFAVFRFRNRPGMPDPKPVHGNTVLEIAWTIAPAIVLALVGIPTVVGIYKSQAAPPANALIVQAIGSAGQPGSLPLTCILLPLALFPLLGAVRGCPVQDASRSSATCRAPGANAARFRRPDRARGAQGAA